MKKKTKLIKRTWCYAQHPSIYDIQCQACGLNGNITWSEYVGHIWCYVCEKDRKIENSILNGPIPTSLAHAFGISFDRIILDTQKIDKYLHKHNMFESEIRKLKNRVQTKGLGDQYPDI
jgi:hypothetical protein